MRTKLLALLLVLLFAASARAQSWGTPVFSSGSVSSSTTGTITLTSSIGAGDAVLIMAEVSQAFISSTNNSGTFASIPCSGMRNGGTFGQSSQCGWIQNAGAQSSTIQITFNASTSGNIGVLDVPYSGGTPQYDGANGNIIPSSSTSLVAATFTPSTTNTLSFQMCTSASTCNSITAPFTAAGAHWAYVTNQTSAWTGPTWTLSGADATAAAAQMEFGFGATAPLNQAFVQFQGTNNTNITAATILSNGNVKGWQGANPVYNGTAGALTYQTSAAAPGSVTGRLQDGSTLIDAATTGMQYSTGPSGGGCAPCTTNASTYIQLGSTGNNILPATTATQSVIIQSNVPAGHNDHIDTFDIWGFGSSDVMNAMELDVGGGTARGFGLECLSGQGPSTVTTLRSTPYQLEEQFHVGGKNILSIYNVSLVNGVWQTGSLVGSLNCNQTGTSGPAYFIAGNENANAIYGGNLVTFNGWKISQDGATFPIPASATTTWTPLTASSTDVQRDLTPASFGDTISIPAGSPTWSTQVSKTLAGPLTIQGQTACSGSFCAPGSAGVGYASAYPSDTTNITTNNGSNPSLLISNASAINFFRLTGISFTNTQSSFNGSVAISGNPFDVAFRVDHVHVNLNTTGGGVFFSTSRVFGLLDHIYYQDIRNVGNDGNPMRSDGDSTTLGYGNWLRSNPVGTQNAVITEDSAFTTSAPYPEGWWDCYQGASIVLRYSIIAGNSPGGCHGTDSGGVRSPVSVEMYNLTISNSTGTNESIAFSRGGVLLFHDNVATGSTHFTTASLVYFRYAPEVAQNPAMIGWGTFLPGLNWTPTPQGGGTNTLNAPDWQASHSYTCSTSVPCVIGPTSNNTGGYNFASQANCASSSSRPAFNQSLSTWTNVTTPATNLTTDNTCTWPNVGGTNAAGPGGDGFSNVDNETTCNSGGACVRFFDTGSGAYPGRDQPCVAPGQVVYGCYANNNTGVAMPATVLGPDTGSAGVIQSGRDYFNTTTPSGGWPLYTYPDPLQGSSPATVSPTSEVFPAHAVGTQSASQTVTVTNATGSTITFTGNTFTSTGALPGTNYLITSTTCGGTLVSPSTCTISLAFLPTTIGTLTDTFNIPFTGGSGSPLQVSLSGTGIAGSASGAPTLQAGN